MADIPDGVSRDVAQIAVAWEIVKKSYERSNEFPSSEPSKKAEILTDLMVDVFLALRGERHLNEKPAD